MRKHDFRKWIAHTYFLLTIVGLRFFYLDPDDLGFSIFLLGCHTTVYPIFGMVLAVDHGLLILRNVIFVFWILYLISFVVSYLIAWLRRRYLPLALIALVDAVFSLVIVCWAIVSIGFVPSHILMLIGIPISFLPFLGLLFGDRFRRNTNKSA